MHISKHMHACDRYNFSTLAASIQMATLQLTKESHKDPAKFRITYEDANRVLGEKKTWARADGPALKTLSKVAIIGGGFGGIAAAMRFKKQMKEEDFVIFEKHDQFGGTWWANTYPGCASDIPALWYSFYDELNKNWSELQPPQYEMEEYILQVVKKYKLEEKARCKSAIEKFVWDDENSEWVLHGVNLENGQAIEHRSKIVALARGGLVMPNQFRAKGLENFKGVYMHSALFNHDVSFKGKKVVVIGNGCSGNQLVPALVKDYEPESVVQIVRSKHYIMPPLPSALHKLYQLLLFSRIGLVIVRLLIVFGAELRYPMYAGDGFFARLIRRACTRASLRYMNKYCPDEYKQYIIPDYKIGCKRIIFDKYYMPILRDSRLRIQGGDISHIEEHGVVMKDGTKVPADIIVACTGYDIKENALSAKIIGRNGKDVGELWDEEGGISAYETTMIKGCPNMFLVAGPNSATGHASVVMALENCCSYIMKVTQPILAGKYASVEVLPKAYDNWFVTVQKKLSTAVFGTKFGGCVSWYTEEGVNLTAYPWSQIVYWWRMNHPKWNELVYEKPKQK